MNHHGPCFGNPATPFQYFWKNKPSKSQFSGSLIWVLRMFRRWRAAQPPPKPKFPRICGFLNPTPKVPERQLGGRADDGWDDDQDVVWYDIYWYMAFEICETLTRDNITISYDIIMIDHIYIYIWYVHDNSCYINFISCYHKVLWYIDPFSMKKTRHPVSPLCSSEAPCADMADRPGGRRWSLQRRSTGAWRRGGWGGTNVAWAAAMATMADVKMGSMAFVWKVGNFSMKHWEWGPFFLVGGIYGVK